jgi:outer membrane immunogenic protein
MTIHRACLAGAFCAMISVTANAAGSPAKTAAPLTPAAIAVWSGWYVGAEVGYGWGRDHIHDQNLAFGGSDYSDHFNMDGVTGGLYAGYNWQQGLWVNGLEVDAELADISGDNPSWPFGDNTTAKIRAQGSLRARVVYVFAANNLVYATGGLAVADIKTEYFDAPSVDSYSRWRAGWTIGAGLEHAFTPNWFGRVEYRYSDFGRVSDATTLTDTGWEERNDITTHVIRIGITYKFN